MYFSKANTSLSQKKKKFFPFFPLFLYSRLTATFCLPFGFYSENNTDVATFYNFYFVNQSPDDVLASYSRRSSCR